MSAIKKILLSKFSNRQGFRHPLLVAAVLIVVLSLAVPVGLLHAAPGVDGNLTVTTADVVLNRYSAVTGINGDVITVSAISELDDGGAGHYANENLSVGDMIMIYQAQGAEFTDASDTATYGEFAYNSAGRYEFGLVTGISGNDITVDSSSNAPYSCGGIANTYDVADGQVQVVRVPQYASLTVDSSGTIIAADWDGETGGVIALLVQGAAVVDGLIDATGAGFRGGRVDVDAAGHTTHITNYVNNDGNYGVAKGESILGEDDVYYDHGGPYGRGAPANGGGGGNNHNAGGGGGANGNSGGTWTGAGLPDTSENSWANAWDLDDTVDNPGTPLPAYFMDGVNGAGGGRGGYSYAEFNQNALMHSPSYFIWGGNHRGQIGGLGGRPLNNDPATRLFFGGGGGGGDDNNGTGTPGARGGGLIVIAAGSLSGSGDILSNGDDAADIAPNYEDGAGGGGGGGSIVAQIGSASGVVEIMANGGRGGNNGVLGQPTTHQDESFGPGGGGGGGFIALDINSGSLTTAVLGGINGISASEALAEFIPNGATGGYAGNVSNAAFSFPGCLAPTAITLSAATVAARLNWWPLLAFLLLLAASKRVVERLIVD